jgi:transmembrane sensor
MSTKIAKELIEKYQAGTATPDEIALIEKWVMLGTVKELDLSDEELASDFSTIRNQLPLKYERKGVKLWPRIAVAAAAVAAITLSIWIYTSRHPDTDRHPEFISGSPIANDIAPGKNTATLTLANGKTISLSDAKSGVVVGASKLTYSDGTEIIQPSLPARGISPGGRESNSLKGENQMLTATTPRGGTYIVTLPDGTKVWLNADSKLEFPSKFGKNEQRIVRLSGEGYFEVAKVFVKSSNPLSLKGSLPGGENRNQRVPFIVISKGQEVEVLGTHFNISAYGDEVAVKTTLLEGSVKINKSILLKPGQQSISANNDIKIEEVDVNDAVDWKNGEFVFDKEPLEQILQKLARWYDVDITDLRKQKNNITFTGKMSRYDNISKVLSKLALTDEVNFKIEGRKVIVSK